MLRVERHHMAGTDIFGSVPSRRPTLKSCSGCMHAPLTKQHPVSLPKTCLQLLDLLLEVPLVLLFLVLLCGGINLVPDLIEQGHSFVHLFQRPVDFRCRQYIHRQYIATIAVDSQYTAEDTFSTVDTPVDTSQS